MKRILWVGNPFFSAALRELAQGHGWDLTHVNFAAGRTFTWPDLVRAAGEQPPDVLIVADKSLPPFVLGMERFPCLTVFYAVDTHIHSWCQNYAQGFDLCLVSLKDDIPSFYGQRLPPERVLWSPPYAPDLRDPVPPFNPRWDLLFVGKVDRNINPGRAAFMEALAARLPFLHTARGDFMKLYPQGRLNLNHSVHQDLNFRVFEVTGLGGCLLTPRVGHGLTEIFRDREHLFIYDQENMDSLVELVRELLAKPDLQARVRQNAVALVDSAHRASHRAKSLAHKLKALYESGEAKGIIADRLENAGKIHKKWLKFTYLLHAEALPDIAPLEALRARYLMAARE